MVEVSFKIGDMVHTPGGRDGRIAEFSHDNKKVKVNFTFGQQHRWCAVEDCQLVQSPQARQAAAAQSGNRAEVYPVGKLLKNVAGETAKVISQWQDMVKLQPGGNTELTDYEPKGEPFTLSEQDVQQWLLKWLKPGDVVELVDGKIVILREVPLRDLTTAKPITEQEQREAWLGTRFGGENPLIPGMFNVYTLPQIKSKVTAAVAQAFTILADPGNPNQMQQTIDSLRAECTMLHRQIDNFKTVNTHSNSASADTLAEAIEDAAKSKAALLDAEKRIRNLEYTNQQQSKMLSKATALPQNANPPASEQHIMTLVSIGGNAGFGNVEIPPGYQVAAITTEFRPTPGTPQIYRFTHLIGCGDGNNQPRYEEKTESILVVDDVSLSSFEAALKGGLAPEDVINVGNARVIEVAWEATQNRRAAYQPVPMLLTGGHDDQGN